MEVAQGEVLAETLGSVHFVQVKVGALGAQRVRALDNALYQHNDVNLAHGTGRQASTQTTVSPHTSMACVVVAT